MKKLIITNIDHNLYTLKDKNNIIYKFNINFYNLTKLPSTSDIIYISNNLLDKNYIEYSNYYNFGKLNSEYGRNITNENNPDILIIEIEGKKEYLKRLYG